VELYDVVVIGVGGMGSAALFHAARCGARVLGLEQFDIPHDRGSSHGQTRVIRLAYWEHPSYVPLLRRAYELWHELEHVAGRTLLVTTGSIDAGPAASRPMRGALEACQRFDLAHEMLDAAALRRRFPGYRLPRDLVAVFQPDGGFVLPEQCVLAHVHAAQAHGATVQMQEPVVEWTADADGVVVRTTRGSYTTRRLVLTAGPWVGKIAGALRPVVSVERQVVMWVTPRVPEYFQVDRFPVFYLHGSEGSFYGIPMFDGRGFKIGKYHHRRQVVDPDAVERVCDAEDERVLREAIRHYFPDADGPATSMETCLFTNTADEHFIIDRLEPRVVVAGGFSGHGFKFCSVVGEILAELALDGASRHDISLFTGSRFKGFRTRNPEP